MDCVQEEIVPATILKVIYQAARAVSHMHGQAQPIIHRDIKIENFLLDDAGGLKLCDFGSATTEIVQPDNSWSAQQRNLLEDRLANVTTPMYRAPEQLDIWTNHEIGKKVDTWALGCILYCLCFKRHPFEDAAKLRIINGNYTIPTDSRMTCFHDVIRGCFQVDPAKRLDVDTLLERLAAIAETMNWPLKGPLGLKGKPVSGASPDPSPVHQTPQPSAAVHQAAPTRPPPPRPSPLPHHRAAPQRPAEPPRAQTHAPVDQSHPDAQAQGVNGGAAGGLFSSIKGGAGSFLKNLKDTSTKVRSIFPIQYWKYD